MRLPLTSPLVRAWNFLVAEATSLYVTGAGVAKTLSPGERVLPHSSHTIATTCGFSLQKKVLIYQFKIGKNIFPISYLICCSNSTHLAQTVLPEVKGTSLAKRLFLLPRGLPLLFFGGDALTTGTSLKGSSSSTCHSLSLWLESCARGMTF